MARSNNGYHYSGVEYRHHDATECIRMAEERAGPSVLGYLYRFEWDRSHRCLKLIAFRISKKTPRGWKILTGSSSYAQPKQILENTRRRFAAKSVDVALESYLARKKMYVSILEHQLSEAKEQLSAGKRSEAYPTKLAGPKRELAFLIDGTVFEDPSPSTSTLYRELTG